MKKTCLLWTVGNRCSSLKKFCRKRQYLIRLTSSYMDGLHGHFKCYKRRIVLCYRVFHLMLPEIRTDTDQNI